MNKKEKGLKKYMKCWIYLFFLVLLLGVVVSSIRFHKKMVSMGTSTGEAIGTSAGKVIGSFQALEEYPKARAEGKEEGLSAKDTVADIANQIKDTKKLEVLAASVKLNDMHSIGDDYKALYLLKGEAVFTVDLSKAVITEEEEALAIAIPEPEMEFYIDQSKMKKVAEYQKYFFSGKAEDGFDAYLNTMAKTKEASKETIANYDALMESARESARKQVSQLANAASVIKKEVNISFIEAKEDIHE